MRPNTPDRGSGGPSLLGISLLAALGGGSACGVFADQQTFTLAPSNDGGTHPPDDGGTKIACSPACEDGARCGMNGDCASGICTGERCIAPGCAPSCVDGNVCGADMDCASRSCVKGACAVPSCAPTCQDGARCGGNEDCGSGICTGGKCLAPACSPTCTVSEACGQNDDCSSGLCEKAHCSDAKNCAALLALNPAAPSGVYEIDPDGPASAPPFHAFCDMKTSGGGWTKVFDQDVSVAPGYQPISNWLSGVDVSDPTSGQYSILEELPLLKNGSTYAFRLVWPKTPNGGFVEWTQVEDPLTAPATPTISHVQMSPAGQSGCTSFRGLASNVDGDAALEGDSTVNCYYWAVGTPASWNSGIPSYSTNPSAGTPETVLWVR